MKVLVVHRQKEIIEKIKSVLRSNESIIRFSDSGLDGLLAARIEIFDLIICSTDLPVITGFELVRSVKTNSMNRNTPVVFLTDTKDEKTAHLGHALGVVGILSPDEVHVHLPTIVSTEVKVAPNTRWEDLLSKSSIELLN